MTQSLWAEHEVASVRVELAHGIVQLLCDSRGLHALHIKGFALDPALRHPGRVGTDVDLLVRPAHIEAARAVLRCHGWERVGRFATGSPFEHAENWHHDTLGYLDLHRLIPGIGLPADQAFDFLWTGRSTAMLAQVACPVPSRDAQALVLLLHAARSHGDQRSRRDVDHVWRDADAATRQRIRELVVTARSEVAFAAAVGDLERYRARPEYLLWKVNSTPGADRTTEWWARIRAAHGPRRKLSLLCRAVLVNRDHLRTLRDHEPSHTEVLHEFLRRASVAVREVAGRKRLR